MWKQKSQIVTAVVAIFHVNFTGQSQGSVVSTGQSQGSVVTTGQSQGSVVSTGQSG